MSKRIFSCIVRLPRNIDLNIHNVYMPTDTQYDTENLDVFCDVLSEIEAISSIHENIHTVIAGDFNTDFSRSQSLHTNALLNFCHEHSLSLCYVLL